MYTINGYGSMLADRERVNAYARALQSVINPGSVVLDVGTGIGFFALLACRYGAGKVYAIEPGDAITVAQQLAVENGCADRIVFIQDLAKNVTLPEKATIVISDLRGSIPLYGHHIPSIMDIRRRLLAPEAVMIPARDSMWASLVSSPAAYRELVRPWQEPNHDINMQSALLLATNDLLTLRTPDPDKRALVEPQCWAELDYYTINNVNVTGDLSWRMAQVGRAHGIKIWFDTMLTNKIGFSNAVNRPEKVYGSPLLPWPQEVLLNPGDEISVSLKASLVDDDYVWSWNTRIRSASGGQVRETVFEQSTFKGTPLSLPRIKKRSENFRPELNEEGLGDKHILMLMAEGKPLKNIAEDIVDRFPDVYTDYGQALNRVGKLSLKYSK